MKTGTQIKALLDLALLAGLILLGSAALTPGQKSKPKGYWVVNSDIVNEEGHKDYVAANRAIFGQYGAKFLVRWGQKQVVEGKAPRSRQVIIEFKSYEDALACYHSNQYEAAHKKREGGVAVADMVIVEGYDGPQPGQ